VIRAAFAAIGRSHVAILTIAATYAVSILVGVAMVSSGSAVALDRRDQIVGAAQSSGRWCNRPEASNAGHCRQSASLSSAVDKPAERDTWLFLL